LNALRYVGPAAAEAVPTLVEILKSPPHPEINNRLGAMYALGEMGPAAAPAVPRLSEMLSPEASPEERSAAAQTLGRIGADAKPAVPAFREAWEKRLITVEDARALYKIDPEAAQELGIPGK
jgi:HEAT repeat protein